MEPAKISPCTLATSSTPVALRYSSGLSDSNLSLCTSQVWLRALGRQWVVCNVSRARRPHKTATKSQKVGSIKVSFCFNSVCSTLVTILSRQLCYNEWKAKNQVASLNDFEGYWKGLSNSVKRVSDFPPPHCIASNLTLPQSEIHDPGEEECM